MSLHAAVRTVRRLLCFACCAVAVNVGIATSVAHTQSTASPELLVAAREDSMGAGDRRLLQPLQRIMDLDSALAMSALPRLRYDASRDLARATVINHRETGDSLRAGTRRQGDNNTIRAHYKSGLEDEARRRLRLTDRDVDLSYVTNAIALQHTALRMIDGELTAGLQTDAVRAHIAAARVYTVQRLTYAEELQRELLGERTDRR